MNKAEEKNLQRRIYKIKKDDLILVIVGKDKGKTGNVEKVLSKEGKIVVNGINILKRHKKKGSHNLRGGIIEFPAPMDISNVQVVCQSCNKPTRITYKVISNAKYRICKGCKANLDRIK
ncbi:MAG: 50S ribosomal protein L24 [Candidatus Nealsonbacteria bacterium CG23_combo_of_CG06-09_8_20_14_all_40_13]|uniref:Large ribosomal subunit protein uL24 n=1 Tax=Candidatus Nealsonbacteria bacterium CG23_combo_of_CG06-09_8_20_14_all_40_13 TaxID=1974724 RepID=A0A2G9YQZ5_9BACT|nr:MAG: 50S ribosomal protein L24 [Candidatus Nealsonbacteria bacterium CG23_combo_of_CG06-09_8_20_14_all_40_13]PIR71200.1 MAG: 50S ribosomal protein L24 [Candidatus Nealsonbacteria bacterium CG10_big_fil_rev_8_21_14_0_10_40_24]PIU43436.1 MAG: 50S ribosomal protein L24 [Candidatus Nealsonbacteria bacterium CG07_land_8_20_14_0_80_40_10]